MGFLQFFLLFQAERIFKLVCPDEEFLPTPPNPEDIIHVDDTTATSSSAQDGQSEFNTGEGNMAETGEGDEQEERNGAGKKALVGTETIKDEGTGDSQQVNIEKGSADTEVLHSDKCISES